MGTEQGGMSGPESRQRRISHNSPAVVVGLALLFGLGSGMALICCTGLFKFVG